MSRTSTMPRATRSTLDVYLNEIQRYPLLERARENELARRTRAGDAIAREELIRSNLRFVVAIAKRYVGNGVALEDLVNEGNLGLVRAAERFDPERGHKFISYAVWWIRQGILHAVSEHSRLVRLPMNRVALAQKATRAARQMEQHLGREAHPDEIASALNVTADEIEEVAIFSRPHLSLDEPVGDGTDDLTFANQIEDTNSEQPDSALNAELANRSLRRMLDGLGDRERTIISLYYGMESGEPLTLEQIGKRLGYTRERIRQIKEQAIEKLRVKARPLGDYASA
ncbi:MAG TPA: RNA polymerase sigma factor RpoD/SigA [Candidatus Krumholzibacteria bacterium]|nr:RNA polymerase sigma factor RpoD/SigA [Candidatus Krumholzibacteria bacterium]